ncbi:uncharacterized protein LOC118496496 [Sander lucioperca]|uniref:uncharacterized protein LOC118496496 n=1 Tax=Sander lucioperca TaxID=283035 RepID=UPI001653C85E|nr:uncharacterized protein LOC118496496 [Sander lucioperca]
MAVFPVDLMSKDSIIIPAWSPQPGKADHYLLCVLQPAKRELFLLDSLKPDGFGDSHNIFRFGNMTTISPVLWLVQYGNPTEFIVLQKCSDLAHHIALGQWTTKFGKDIEGFPQQTTVNYCGILMLMYALSLSTEAPFWFIERDMARIRKWWCISLMERFQIDGHGQRFAYWTNEARALLQGSLQPISRVPKVRKREHEVSMMMAEDTQWPSPVLIESLKKTC